MLLCLVIMLGLVLLGLGMVWRKLDELILASRRSIEVQTDILRAQLNPRTRMGRVAPVTGPPSVERQQKRLGTVSAGRRVVVGGEEDSQLFQDLNRSHFEEGNDGR